jgi:kinesin family protein 5
MRSSVWDPNDNNNGHNNKITLGIGRSPLSSGANLHEMETECVPSNSSDSTNSDISENIKVYIRLRPILESDACLEGSIPSAQSCLDMVGGGECHYSNGDPKRDSSFKFTKCFGVDSSQVSVFESVAVPIVDSVLRGYNGTILAYGPTNSGKTYTMRGLGDNKDSAFVGVIPRCVEYMLANVMSDAELWVSYLQIYCETVSDLLTATSSTASYNALQIRERSGQVYVEGLSSCRVTSQYDLRAVLEQGDANRHTASTNINQTSSRSHAALIIKVISAASPPQNSASTVTRQESTLVLVDLAGSER